MKKICAGFYVILFAVSLTYAQTGSDKTSKATPEVTQKVLAALIENNSFYRLESSENRISDVKFKGCQLDFKVRSVFIRPRQENYYQDANVQRRNADLFKNYSAQRSSVYSVNLKDLDLNSFQIRPLASNMFNAEPETNYRFTPLQENLIQLRVNTISDRNEVLIKFDKTAVPSSFISLVVRKEAAEQIKNGLIALIDTCQETN